MSMLHIHCYIRSHSRRHTNTLEDRRYRKERLDVRDTKAVGALFDGSRARLCNSSREKADVSRFIG